jgi:hypothetical protein
VNGGWWLLNFELRILNGMLAGLQSGNGKRMAGGENVRLKLNLAYEEIIDAHLIRQIKKSRHRGSHLLKILSNRPCLCQKQGDAHLCWTLAESEK